MTASFRSRLLTLLILSVTALHLLGCSSIRKSQADAERRGVDYKQAKSAPRLEVPPDLTSSTIDESMVVPDLAPSAAGSATYSAYSGERPSTGARRPAPVLLSSENVWVERDEDRYWLVVGNEPEVVWPKLREFWINNNWILTIEDPRIGIMETDWAENRADIPQGPIRNFLGKVLDSAYTAATRDRFRTRIERGEAAGTTEIFLTHRGMVEELTGSVDSETAVWIPRPSDPELEVEMLRRIAVHLGVEEQRSDRLLATAPDASAPRTRLIKDSAGQSVLRIDEGFSDAWRMTGLALDRVGFTVEDRDRASGIYYVRYLDPMKAETKKGLLSRFAFWKGQDKKKPQQYQVALAPSGGYTDVAVRGADGAVEDSETAGRILALLHEQLR
jgi:outer membrane protein assembly factor BamC